LSSTWAEILRDGRVHQGDIFRDIQFIEYVKREGAEIEISMIEFPLVLVLTQDCDLASDFQWRRAGDVEKPSKALISVIVAPMYNEGFVAQGTHLELLGIRKMGDFRSSNLDRLRTNQIERYHYLGKSEVVPELQPQVIDFKHYFTVLVSELERKMSTNFVCKVRELYREDISARFAHFLSRIGLPETINENLSGQSPTGA
jgi:hypothetical protein